VQAIFRNACSGTYATGHCAGGAQPGCCNLPPAVDGTVMKTCSHNVSDPDGALKRQCVEGFSGTWN
jgi:hypothetical protein